MQFQKNSNPCNRNKILKSKLKKKNIKPNCSKTYEVQMLELD